MIDLTAATIWCEGLATGLTAGRRSSDRSTNGQASRCSVRSSRSPCMASRARTQRGSAPTVGPRRGPWIRRRRPSRNRPGGRQQQLSDASVGDHVVRARSLNAHRVDHERADGQHLRESRRLCATVPRSGAFAVARRGRDLRPQRAGMSRRCPASLRVGERSFR